MILQHPVLVSLIRGRFSALLLTLAILLLVGPLIPADRIVLEKALSAFGLVVLISCLRAISSSRRFFIIMVVLSLVNVGIGSAQIFSRPDSDVFKTIVLGFRLVFYLLVFFSIMGSVLDPNPVTTDKICGAISAYLLIGLIWANIYSLFQHLQPGSFALPEQFQTDSITAIWSIYFSFTTLTTLGYGDITPQLPGVQIYAFMEAACGQVFLAVLVARLVALQIMHNPAHQHMVQEKENK